MATTSPNTIHALVRLLKSSTDPSSTSGPSKIEVACCAWSDPSFYAANKGEVIGEWILTLFGQAKKTRREKDTFDPIADSRYWTLLCAVLTAPPHTTARPTKTWLLPLLNRFQVDAIVTELLSLHSPQVLAPARAALTVLWPLAEKKVSVDALAECLSAVFNACTESEHVDDNLCWICSAVITTYRNSLANSGNKKKFYNFFLTTHLSSWLCAICTSPPPVGLSSSIRLHDSIYAAGTDTIFSLDALKQPLGTLFDAFSLSIPSTFPVLPKLCTSFIRATNKYKSALFASSNGVVSGKEEVRKRGMEFVGRCWTLIWGSTSLQENFEVERWSSAIDLLRIVEKERLFVAHPVRGVRTDAAEGEYGELTLNEARDKAFEVLEGVDTYSQEKGLFSIQLLDALVQIEYDFVGSLLERILAALISIPRPLLHVVTTTTSDFLAHILEYHTKTRTVHTYALALLGAAVASSTAPQTSASWSTTSAYPLAYHLPSFARAIRTSLTPTQTAPLTTAVVRAVEHAWKAFKDAEEAKDMRSVKRRRVMESTYESGGEARPVQVQVRIFSYTARVAGTILSSLPVDTYTRDEERSLEYLWSDVGKLGWNVVWDCLGEKTRKRHDNVEGRDSKKRKHATKTGPLPGLHAVTSSALRFLYDVRTQLSSPLGDCDQLGEAQVEILLNVAQDEASEPELVLEIIRTLLWHVSYTHSHGSQNQAEVHQIISATLDVLATRPLSKLKWSGISAELTRDNLGLAVLYVLTERWIDIFDGLASTENLKRLVSLLIEVFLDLSDEDNRGRSDQDDSQRDNPSITSRGILLGLLRNAQFWELHNIRAVFLSSVLTLTAPLFPTTIVESPSPISATELTLACNAYSLLHYVHPEYFTRPVRTELVKGAMVADVQICMVLEGANGDGSDVERRTKSYVEDLDDKPPLKKWSRRLTFVRVFLQRMGQFLGTTSYTTSLTFVKHLLDPPLLLSAPKALATVTLELIQLHLVSFLRSQEPDAAVSITNVISTLITSRPFSQSGPQKTLAQLVSQSSALKLIECATGDFDPASLSEDFERALKMLLEALESALSSHVKTLAENDAKELDPLPSNEQIHAWSRILSLRRWLGMNPQVAAVPFGLKLATITIRSQHATGLDSETCSYIFEVLFEELWCMPDAARRVHLDVLVSFYAVVGGDSSVGRVMDVHVTQASKRMSVGDFSRLLDVLEEGIGGNGLKARRLERLIHLGQLILHDAPQGTLKAIQHFATRCFNLFVDRKEIHGGPSVLKLQCLEFVARHCSDRPTAIRPVDLGSIWSLLNKLLSGSSEHDTTTVFPIFHHIVTIIGSLIRLRRDLVVHTLPHLSLVLCQMMMLTRKIRPQLGAKQSKIVTDTFPSWLSASQPLSTDEARALARLLTSLTTKTVPRRQTHASTESQKAESLTRPFAKHASYVLVAYVDAFSDPLCIMNAETRRELEPGLFALCEMVGEHSRDALMVSMLDSGGKTIMKSLWKEYEKQRYVGKG